jgi:hypothetical protein|tara:strand:+ start:204 stop:473 length:270 start_codon:yes stop_codon:yes gene_type:complete
VSRYINVELKKKTILEAMNIVRVQRDLGFPAYQKGEPIHDLLMEIKRDVNRQTKQNKVSAWKEFLHFWPLSIMCPLFLLLILGGVIAGI